jgi:hypothetical protein
MPPEDESQVTKQGFYFDHRTSELIEFHLDDKFPYDAGKWEFIGTSDELTPADAVARLMELYPDITVQLKTCADVPIHGHEVFIHGIHGRPREGKGTGETF